MVDVAHDASPFVYRIGLRRIAGKGVKKCDHSCNYAATLGRPSGFLRVARAGRDRACGGRGGGRCDDAARATCDGWRRARQTLFEQSREGQVLTAAGRRCWSRWRRWGRRRQGSCRPTTIPTACPAGAAGERIGGVRHVVRGASPARFHRAPSRPDDRSRRSSGFPQSLTPRGADVAILLARPQTGPLVSSKLTDYTLGLYAGELYAARPTRCRRPRRKVRDHPLVGYVRPAVRARTALSRRDRGGAVPAYPQLQHQRPISADRAGAGLGVLPRFNGDADKSLRRVLPERTIAGRSGW